MNGLKKTSKLFFFLVLFGFCAFSVFAQETKNTPEPSEAAKNPDDEILKVDTELIQTGVAVFDKRGQFVDNLQREDFELIIDGKPAPISFFEPNVVSNRSGEIKRKADDSRLKNSASNSIRPLEGRTVIFVVDDLHLSFDSHYRMKKLIEKFLETEMLPEDTVAVVSSTGKIGFLQQFTNDKTVLRAAVERLIYNRDRSAADRSIPPMSEYEALLISQFDREVTDIFIASELGDIDSRREAVRSRARTILTQAAAVNRGTYSTLEQAVRSSAQLAGRKIVFFISDGFLLDPTNTDSAYLLKRITDAAARTNTVVYSLDSRGLEAGFPEGTTASTVAAYRVQSGERSERQDGLNLLAEDTGGQFVRNTNDLQTGLTKSLNEASQFYLLAWEPVSENSKSEKFRKIEVRVKNRPELKIRVQSGYFSEKPKTVVENKPKNKQEKNNQPASVPEQKLNAAVTAQIPSRLLPTTLAVNYIDVLNEGALLAAAMQVNTDAVEFETRGDKAVAGVDILGILYNSEGKREGFFRQLLNVDIAASKLAKTDRPKLYYNYQAKLKPGLYQMRVAARDIKSGRVGSAVQWIQIPDLTARKLTLSSLLIGEQYNDGEKKSRENNLTNVGLLEMPISVDRRFARSSILRYLVFVYNASSKAKPDVTIQTQVWRGKNMILTSAANPISVEGQDAARLPYAAEISLNTLLPGRYELQITVQDRNAKTDIARRVSFEVR